MLRRRARRAQCDSGAMDLSAGSCADLLLRLLLVAVPDQGAQRPARNSPRWQLSPSHRPVLRGNSLLARAVALLALVEQHNADDRDLAWHCGIAARFLEPVAASNALHLLRVLSFIREYGGRLLQLPI